MQNVRFSSISCVSQHCEHQKGARRKLNSADGKTDRERARARERESRGHGAASGTRQPECCFSFFGASNRESRRNLIFPPSLQCYTIKGIVRERVEEQRIEASCAKGENKVVHEEVEEIGGD